MKIYRWIQGLVGKSLKRTRLFAAAKYLLKNMYYITKAKFTVEKPSRNYLNRVIKVNNTCVKVIKESLRNCHR